MLFWHTYKFNNGRYYRFLQTDLRLNVHSDVQNTVVCTSWKSKTKTGFQIDASRWHSQPIKDEKQILAHRRTSSKHQFDKSSKRKANCVMRFLKGCLPCSLSPIKISKIVQELNKSTSDLDTRHPKTINCYKVKLFLSQNF